MPDLLTLTGTVVDHDGGAPLAGVEVTATPSRIVTRTSDGEDALTDASTTSDETGAFSLALVSAAGLRYLISYRAGGKRVRPYVLDCDSWPAGSTVTVADLPPIATGPDPTPWEIQQAWLLAQIGAIVAPDLSGYALTSSLGTAAAADVGDFASATPTDLDNGYLSI